MQELGNATDFLTEKGWTGIWIRALPFIQLRAGRGFDRQYFLDEIIVGISDKIKTSLGYAHYKRPRVAPRILLHPVLFDAPETELAGAWNGDEELQNTFFHELAHHVTHMIWPRASAHGMEWGMTMAWFNLYPVRTHALSAARLSTYRDRRFEAEAQNILEDF